MKNMSPINKLHISVICGWGIMLLTILYHLMKSYGSMGDNLFVGIIWAYIFLSVRYSVLKPVELTGAVFAGWATTTILDYFSGVRNAGPNIIFWTFALMVVLYYFIKGVILSTYFLLRETYQLIKYYRNKKAFIHIQTPQ